jgi:hypothetical protein
MWKGHHLGATSGHETPPVFLCCPETDFCALVGKEGSLSRERTYENDFSWWVFKSPICFVLIPLWYVNLSTPHLLLSILIFNQEECHSSITKWKILIIEV